MRLEPSDKPMYHRMDQRDRALIMIPVFGIAASFGLFFLAARFPEGGESEIRGSGENRRCLFYVSPFGYPEEKMQAVYQTIKERLPETAEIYEYET